MKQYTAYEIDEMAERLKEVRKQLRYLSKEEEELTATLKGIFQDGGWVIGGKTFLKIVTKITRRLNLDLLTKSLNEKIGESATKELLTECKPPESSRVLTLDEITK